METSTNQISSYGILFNAFIILMLIDYLLFKFNKEKYAKLFIPIKSFTISHNQLGWDKIINIVEFDHISALSHKYKYLLSKITFVTPLIRLKMKENIATKMTLMLSIPQMISLSGIFTFFILFGSADFFSRKAESTQIQMEWFLIIVPTVAFVIMIWVNLRSSLTIISDHGVLESAARIKSFREATSNLRFRLVLSIILFFPCAMILMIITGEKYLVVFFIIFCLAVYYHAIKIHAVICPSCGKRFFIKWYMRFILTGNCLHCGFSLKEPKSSDLRI